MTHTERVSRGCVCFMVKRVNKFYKFGGYRYLGIVGALAAEADYVFFPECPPPVDWPEKLCKKLEQACYEQQFIKQTSVFFSLSKFCLVYKYCPIFFLVSCTCTN